MSVPIRPAATVMLVRDAGDDGGGIEVCMLRRNLASEFVAGAYVFPGGSVDDADHDPALTHRCRGRSGEDASALLGVDTGGLAYWIAAVRECFEEAGILLAASRETSGTVGGLVDTTDPAVRDRFSGYRRALNEGRIDLAEVCQAEDLVLAVDDLHYVSHWITPLLAPRRYDTRFFVTLAPTDQVARHDDTETIATAWIRPGEALRRARAGQIELLPPTVANLRTLERFASGSDVMDWAGRVTEVTPVLPVVKLDGDALLILRPGDAGYQDALEEQLASGSAVDPALAHLVRERWGPSAGSP